MKTTRIFSFPFSVLALIAIITPLELLIGQGNIMPNYSRMPDGDINEPYSFQFFLSHATSGYRWAMVDASIPGQHLNIGNTNLQINQTSGEVTAASGRLAGPQGTYRVNISVTPDAGSGNPPVASRTYDFVLKNTVTACPTIREYVLLLDKSGSMHGTKWDILKGCVKAYLPTLNNQMTSSDYLTVMYFNGNSASVKSSKQPFRQPWMSNQTDIENTLFNVSVNLTDLTPLGDGLIDAIADLNTNPVNTIQSIIVFSDGMQTIGPYLKPDEPDRYEIIQTTPAVNLNASPNDKIKIFTIGVGAIPGYTDMLRDLANVDNDYAQADVATSDELNIFFTRTIPASLRYCTPRFLHYRTGELNGEDVEKREAFQVNKFIEKLTIRVIPDENARLSDDWRLYKDGVPITTISPAWDGLSLIYSIDFPLSFDGGNSYVDESGKWEVGLKGLKGGKYEIMAMVEDDYLQTDIALGKPVSSTTSTGGTANSNPAYTGLQYAVNVGDEIRVQASLTFIGNPLTNVQEVEAFLLRPGDDLGDLAAETYVSGKDLNPAEPNTPLGQAKIDSLMRDSAFVAKLKKTIQPSPMSHIGNGIYSTSFTDNKVTGTYRAVVRFRGTLPGAGEFEGWETKCILVDFGEPGDIDLNTAQVFATGADKKGSYRVKFTPTNRFNRKLGPGQVNRIKVQLQPGGPVNIIDNLDGSYTIDRTFGPNENPFIQVNVIDSETPVYSGSLYGLAGRKWFLSAHLGTAFPVSKFDAATYKTGYFAEVDFGRMLSRMFYLEAVGGYYNFGSQKYIIGGSLYAGILPPIGANYKLNLGLGGGYYKPKNEDAEGGLSVRLGIRRSLNANLDACLDGTYFYLPKTERAFATVGLGVKYFF
ncbi:MAG: hypothetical protein EPGJADBJ_00628 [Saprospiraceae bacterium]|nr:hypothetical protein [Saprospiraceae bacterium]